jgi:predicted GNAT family acetyltransferase
MTTGDDVYVERVRDAAAFLELTGELLRAEPVLTNVLSTAALGMVTDATRYPRADWWVVRVDGGRVVGCAGHRPPHPVILAPMPTAAAAALATVLDDPDRCEVVGPHDVVIAYAAAVPRRSIQTVMKEYVYTLGTFRHPPTVIGAARAATQSDVGLLIRWTEQFARDAGIESAGADASVRTRLSNPSSESWIWQLDDTPVAMASSAPAVAGPVGPVARIGPVYTPTQYRRRGFGTAVTAAVTDRLRQRCPVVMLHADAANPTSNSIYRRLGFTPTARVDHVRFS